MIDKEANIITSDDILGKDVLDTDGELIGVVQKLHIDKIGKKIVGITIDEGFMKPDLFIGIEHVKTFGVDSIFLSTTPKQKFVGTRVFDVEGKFMGTIKEVTLQASTSTISAILIKGSKFKEKVIYAKDIKTIGYNVILKERLDYYT